MKLVDVKSNTYIDSRKETNEKDLKYKMVIMSEYQNIKIFWQKITLKIVRKKFLWLKKLKILYCGHMLLMILIEKKLSERLTKINCKKQIKNNFELK